MVKEQNYKFYLLRSKSSFEQNKSWTKWNVVNLYFVRSYKGNGELDNGKI